jgi:hypothetical protein
MTPNYQNRARLAPIIALLLVTCTTFLSCNAHDKAVGFIRNTVRVEVEQLNNNTDLKVCNPMQTLGQMIKAQSVTEIISDRSELIATQ